MVLIKHRDNSDPLYKLKKFEDFMLNELRINLAFEYHLALFYFLGYAGKFVNIERTMKLGKAIDSLKGTAWDVHLLRLPIDMLTPDNLPDIALG